MRPVVDGDHQPRQTRARSPTALASVSVRVVPFSRPGNLVVSSQPATTDDKEQTRPADQAPGSSSSGRVATSSYSSRGSSPGDDLVLPDGCRLAPAIVPMPSRTLLPAVAVACLAYVGRSAGAEVRQSRADTSQPQGKLDEQSDPPDWENQQQ